MPQVATDAAGHIVVGPNVAVDVHADTPFVEPAIAVDQNNPQHLIGASMYYASTTWTSSAFGSTDGGSTWIASTLPSDLDDLGDVQVAYGIDGSAYFAALGTGLNTKTGARQHGLYLFHSQDGKSWYRQTFLHRSYDHEQMLIDHTRGKYRGRIYLFVLYTSLRKPGANELGMLYSSDGGKTFAGPVPIVTGWNFNSNLASFSDGTLFVGYNQSHSNPGEWNPESTIKFVTSSDGGASFSAPRTIGTRYTISKAGYAAVQRSRATDWDGDTVPRYAIDDHSARFLNRVYVVWSDLRSGTSRILLSRSSDRGRTWSAPKIIAADSPPRGSQYQPSIAISPTGIVGVTWFDTRDTSNRNTYREYFSASLDGGQTFLKPVSVSSAASYALGSTNASFYPAGSAAYKDSLYVFLTSPIGRFPDGGDYMGLTVDSAGVFHPFWIDSRYGVYQVETAPVVVNATVPARPPLDAADLTPSVSLQFGHSVWDPKAGILSVPVALQNTSHQGIYGPIVLTVTLVLLPSSSKSETAYLENASNGKNGIGATFDYSNALGDAGLLAPGAVSAPVVWKIKAGLAAVQPTVAVRVQGFVARPQH